MYNIFPYLLSFAGTGQLHVHGNHPTLMIRSRDFFFHPGYCPIRSDDGKLNEVSIPGEEGSCSGKGHRKEYPVQ